MYIKVQNYKNCVEDGTANSVNKSASKIHWAMGLLITVFSNKVNKMFAKDGGGKELEFAIQHGSFCTLALHVIKYRYKS